MNRLKQLLHDVSNSTLDPGARPIGVTVRETKKAFLLLHGFTGIPKELSSMASVLSEMGFSSYCPRYPGHGTNREDFLNTDAYDWVRKAVDTYLEMKSEYETVNVLGHSMGGLIAALLASSFEVPHLILLAPAFRISTRMVRYTPYIAPFCPVLKKGRSLPDTETDPVRRRLFMDYWADDHVYGASNLERIRKTAIRRLPDIRSNVLVLTGSKDLTVQPTVGNYLQKAMIRASSFENQLLEGAGHRFPFDSDSERAVEIVRDWIRRETGS